MSRVINNCLIAVRNLPLKAFKLPTDGKRWRERARSRQALLMYYATFANGDGAIGKYSPGMERTSEHSFSPSWIHILDDDLKALKFLTWTRLNHHSRRQYTILVANFPKEPDKKAGKEDGSTSTLGLMCSESEHPHSNPGTPTLNDQNTSTETQEHLNSGVKPSVHPSLRPSVSNDEGVISQKNGQEKNEEQKPASVADPAPAPPDPMSAVKAAYHRRTGQVFPRTTVLVESIEKLDAATAVAVVERIVTESTWSQVKKPAGFILSKWDDTLEAVRREKAPDWKSPISSSDDSDDAPWTKAQDDEMQAKIEAQCEADRAALKAKQDREAAEADAAVANVDGWL